MRWITSKIDSRTILDGNGADQLIGKGDMLYSTGSDMVRLQCPFVDTPEVDTITGFIGNQRGYPDAHILPEVREESSGDGSDFNADDRDALFEDAARIVVQHQQACVRRCSETVPHLAKPTLPVLSNAVSP